MVVLALETATRAGSVAVWVDGVCHAQAGDPARTHGERLPGELLDLLRAQGLTTDDVDLLAVVSGPGSFTGLRVGIATMQGLALASSRPVVAVPTLEALVIAWRLRQPQASTIVATCLDGQRGDVFFGLYAVEPGEGGQTPSPVQLVPPSVGRPDEAAALLASRLGGRPCVLIGSGAEKYAPVLSRGLTGATLEPVSETLAGAAARLAAARPDAGVMPHALVPFYVRRPDAVIARDRHRAGLAAPAVTPGAFVVSRATTPEDIAAVEALQHDAFHQAWSSGSFRWELEHSDVARLYVMRAPSGELVAYCACWLLVDELHVNSVAVTTAWQRRGLATLLLREVARQAAAAGATSATLEVRESNTAARALYESLGFTVEGVRRDYYQAPREDALILWHRDLRRLPEPGVPNPNPLAAPEALW